MGERLFKLRRRVKTEKTIDELILALQAKSGVGEVIKELGFLPVFIGDMLFGGEVSFSLIIGFCGTLLTFYGLIGG